MNPKKILYNQYLVYKYVFGKVKKYHTGEEKSRLEILKDLFLWQIKEGEFNYMYYAMGLNIKGTDQNEFIGRRSFLKIKNKVESRLKSVANINDLNYDIITKDKFYLTSVLAQNSIPCIKNRALIVKNELIFTEGLIASIEKIKEIGEELILKKITSESGEGVLVCDVRSDGFLINDSKLSLKELKEKLCNSIWVVQDRFKSHSLIQRINSSALNTTRIVTILNGNQPEYLTGFQSFATNYAKTDTWNLGSIYVGINPQNNKLKEIGITNPYNKKQGILKYHPDSGIEFKNYTIPFIKEAVELCKKAHKLLYMNFIIGWDVAITEEGPLILEANEKPGMNVVQCLDGGLKKQITDFAKLWLS